MRGEHSLSGGIAPQEARLFTGALVNIYSESEILMVPVSFLGRGWAGPTNMQLLPLLQASLVYQPSPRDPFSPQRSDSTVGLRPLHFCLLVLELIFWCNSQDMLNSFFSTLLGLSFFFFLRLHYEACGLPHSVTQSVKNLPAVQETWVRSLGGEDPLEKKKATHSSILTWTIPWTQELCGLQLMGLQRVGHN